MKSFISSYGLVIISIVVAGALLMIIYGLTRTDGSIGLKKIQNDTNIYKKEETTDDFNDFYNITDVIEKTDQNIPHVENGAKNEIKFIAPDNINKQTGKTVYTKDMFINILFAQFDENFCIKINDTVISKQEIIDKLKNSDKDIDLVVTKYEAETNINPVTGNKEIKMDEVAAKDAYGVEIKDDDGNIQKVQAVCYTQKTFSLTDTNYPWDETIDNETGLIIDYTVPTRLVVRLRYTYETMKVEYTITVVNKVLSNRKLN